MPKYCWEHTSSPCIPAHKNKCPAPVDVILVSLFQSGQKAPTPETETLPKQVLLAEKLYHLL